MKWLRGYVICIWRIHFIGFIVWKCQLGRSRYFRARIASGAPFP